MIEVAGLTKRFGTTVAVEDVSLTVAEGELLALVGGSGSGKTTTLKMINRLLEPTAGQIAIGGRDVRTYEKHDLRRRIGYVFQQIGLFPHLTVAENIAITPGLLGWDAVRIRERVGELLDLVELSPTMRDRRPVDLSGGEQQRVGVARALAAAPRVMLLDEPFGALDPLTRDHLQRAFLRIRQQLGLTAVFVTHDMAEALLLGDRIGVMRHGRLVQVGTARDLLRSPVDEYVRALTDTPLRQAHVVDALLASDHRTAGPDPSSGNA